MKRLRTLGRIVAYMKPRKWRAAVLALSSVATTLAELAPPLIIRRLVDDVLLPVEEAIATLDERFVMLGWLVLMLLGVRVLSWIAELAHGWVVTWLSARVTADIRAELYRRLEMLSLQFYDKRQVGGLISRITRDAGTLQEFLIDGLPYLVINALMIVGILAFMFTMSWQVTLYILVPVPLLLAWSILFWRRMRRLFHKYGQGWSSLGTQLNEAFHGIRVVKAFSQEHREIRAFDEKNEQLARVSRRTARNWWVLWAMMGLMSAFGMFIIWLAGGMQVLDGVITTGTLLALYSYMWLVYGPLEWFAEVNSWMTRAFAGAERIFEIIDTPPEAYEDPDAVSMPQMQARVMFTEVTFGYDKSKPVLHDITLDVAPGEMIGLVGKSGVGKTTGFGTVGRREAAHRHRPGDSPQPIHPHSGRGDLVRGCRNRETDPGVAGSPGRRAHDLRHCTSPVHPAQCRPPGSPRRRQDSGDRQSRRAAGEEGGVLRAGAVAAIRVPDHRGEGVSRLMTEAAATTNPSPFRELAPPQVRALVDERMESAETVLFCVSTDMADEFTFGQQWLIATDQRLLLVPPSPDGDEPSAAVIETAIADVGEVRIEELVGGSRLEIGRRNAAGRLSLCCSGTQTAKFTEVAAALRQLAAGEALSLPTKLERTRCERCNRLLKEKDGICPFCIRKWDTIKRIAGYLLPHRPKVIEFMLVTFSLTLLGLVPPILVQHIIDDVLTPKTGVDLLVLLACCLLAMELVFFVLGIIDGFIRAHLSAYTTRDIRSQLYQKLQFLPLKFYDKRKVGSLMSRFMNDADRLEMFLLFALPFVLNNAVMLIGIVALLFYLNWQLTIYVLLPVPLIIAAGWRKWGTLRRLWNRWHAKWSRLTIHVNESISGIRVVKAFAQEDVKSVVFCSATMSSETSR